MDSLQKRFTLFLLGCFPMRILIALYAKYLQESNDTSKLFWMSIIAITVSVVWIVLAITGWRKTGAETFGDAIWWSQKGRLFHATMYLIFAYMAYNNIKNAWMVLLADAFAGLTFFLIHHYSQSNFSKLF